MTRFLKTEHVGGDFYTRNFQQGARENTLILNMGPQHPSTHGVLRIILELDGEYIVRAEPVLGYLHRMHERMAESKSYVGFMPNMGRVDYLHPIAWNWAWAGAVEKLAGIEIPKRAEYLRVISCELNRISSHLLWWGAYLLDLGAFTPIMYAFEDRELLMDILQQPTGARLNYSYFRIGGVSDDMTAETLQRLKDFIPYLRARLPIYKDLVTDNIILRKRLVGIAPISAETCRKYGATGPVIRGSGVAYDVRRREPYSAYPLFDFEVPNFPEGDCMARYLVRMEEMAQSLRIIEQAVDRLPEGPVMATAVPRVLKLPAGDVAYAVEAARGRFMVHIVSDNKEIPYRVKLRTPSLSNLSLFEEASQGLVLPDAVALLGSLDLVIPDIDR